ncbi:MAG: FtsK/SpoIIIE domain-containing protein [Planctomycetota bacterium]|nr:FtsK/SpoIIIE domain-containing protein [Planctomycetota bacterium]
MKTDISQIVAALAFRRVQGEFGGTSNSPMLRVNLLLRPEIVALVELLKEWQVSRPESLEIAVTIKAPWPEIPSDVQVPRFGVSPTTLRNRKGIGVILIEADDYTDRQSWTKVHAVSDANLLTCEGDHEALLRSLLERDPPGTLVAVLKQARDAVVSRTEGGYSDRGWIQLVARVCMSLRDETAVDEGRVWDAVGRSLSAADMFPDELLGVGSSVDIRRRLHRNAEQSRRLLDDGDERWLDTLGERLPSVEFEDAAGEPESEQEGIRDRIRDLLDGAGPSALDGVDFRHWLQLVERSSKRRGLGTRIHEFLAAELPDRVAEFERLEVIAALDEREEEAAKRVLDAESEDPEAVAIKDDLKAALRTALERMAHPRAPKTEHPLASLLGSASRLVGERVALCGEEIEPEPVALRIALRGDHSDQTWSAGLFAWLFGPTLREVSRRTIDGNRRLEVESILLDRSPLEEFEVEVKDEEGGSKDAPTFGPLDLRLGWSDGEGGDERFTWDPANTPGLAAFWKEVCHPEFTQWVLGEDVELDSWLSTGLEGLPLKGGRFVSDEPKEIASRWWARREEAFQVLAKEGLVREEVVPYVDEFTAVLRELEDSHVPSGSSSPEVRQVVETDLFLSGDWVAMLACHPVRLRWIERYLEHFTLDLVNVLEGDFRTNPIQPDLYFDQIHQLSPQAQPPIVAFDDNLFLSVRETDWHEQFAPLRDQERERRDWLADIDDGAIDDVADVVARYLDAYPHKADGLHLYYAVRKHGARGLHRLVKSALNLAGKRGRTASLILTLHVEVEELRAVESALQEFDDPDHRAMSDRPRLEVTVLRWKDPSGELPTLPDRAPRIDVAVVPNLFGASTSTRESTKARDAVRGRFDPLFDPPTRLERTGTGDRPTAGVSRVLLPTGHDELLEAWSILATRQFRGKPVEERDAVSGPGTSLDHMTIQVSLEKNRRFFDELHEAAHWVVTVDAFVGREQIEALENAPDVVRVKTGVGANGAYRLVVSTRAGREFVERRIARRLVQQVDGEAIADPSSIARVIYDRARLLVPGLVLRALGLGRTAAEMVGLVLARARVEQVMPAIVGSYGFQSWLSLDEHPEWSGGNRKDRADLARLRGRFEDDVLHLEIDVVEAKMRTQVDVAHAESQLYHSIQLLEAALRQPDDPDDEPLHADVKMWRRMIWSAVEQTSSAADGTPAATHALVRGEPYAGLDETLQAALREGRMVLDGVQGILVSLVDGGHTQDGKTPAHEFRWLRLTLEEAKDELERLRTQQDFPLWATSPEAKDPSSAGVPVESVRKSPSTSGQATEDRGGGERAAADSEPRSNQEGGAPMPGSDARQASDPEVDRPEDSTSDVREPRGGESQAACQRYQDLLDAYQRRNVKVGVPDDLPPALEGPGFYVMRLRLIGDTTPRMLHGMVEDLQLQLGLEAGQLPRLYTDRGHMVVEIPKLDSERYYVDASDLWSRFEWDLDRLQAPIGLDVVDRVIWVDLSSNRSPHILIGGITGGGKSVALETLLLGLVHGYPPDALELRIIDPKGTEFEAFDDLPHLREMPGQDAEDAIELLGRTCDEMDDRYRRMKALGRERRERIRNLIEYNAIAAPELRMHRIVIVLDEFADLTSDRDAKKQIEGLLQRIAQKARACGIHAIVATQKPTADVISTTVRSNLGAQLALRVKNRTDSGVIMDAGGAEALAGNGDAFLRLSGEEPERLQCAQADDEAWQRVRDQYAEVTGA